MHKPDISFTLRKTSKNTGKVSSFLKILKDAITDWLIAMEFQGNPETVMNEAIGRLRIKISEIKKDRVFQVNISICGQAIEFVFSDETGTENWIIGRSPVSDQ